MSSVDVRPGDIIRLPLGVNNAPEIVTVHSVHRYDTGALSVRFRFTTNPRGIDWSGYIAPDGNGIRLLSRGVACVDHATRSLLP